MRLTAATVTGPNNASALAATGGSTVILQGMSFTTNDAADATLLANNGSVVESDGGNTIGNAAANGLALQLIHGSTFGEATGALNPATQAADTISGNASIETASTMGLGTGSSAPSTWNGTITLLDNSAFRMEGGMTVNGAVSLQEGSSGKFKLTATGQNVITGGVLCPFTTTQASHVSVDMSAALLTLGGSTSAVTFGSAANDCLGY
jgi:hypothetical protein